MNAKREVPVENRPMTDAEWQQFLEEENRWHEMMELAAEMRTNNNEDWENDLGR